MLLLIFVVLVAGSEKSKKLSTGSNMMLLDGYGTQNIVIKARSGKIFFVYIWIDRILNSLTEEQFKLYIFGDLVGR